MMLWTRSQECPVKALVRGSSSWLRQDMQTGHSDSCLGLAGSQNPVGKQEDGPAQHPKSQHTPSAATALVAHRHSRADSHCQWHLNSMGKAEQNPTVGRKCKQSESCPTQMQFLSPGSGESLRSCAITPGHAGGQWVPS